MMAIAHEGSRHGGDKGGKSDVKTARGDSGPNRSVAGKYAQAVKGVDYDSLPESKGKEHEGGVWGEEHHKKAHKKTKESREEKSKQKKQKSKKGDKPIKNKLNDIKKIFAAAVPKNLSQKIKKHKMMLTKKGSRRKFCH